MLFNRELLEHFNFGVMILSEDLKVEYWNSWLSFMTKIQAKKIIGKELNTIFDFNEKKVRRAIKVSKAIGTSIYFSSKEGYLIPIELDEITNPIYKYMQQEVTIYPLDKNRVLNNSDTKTCKN